MTLWQVFLDTVRSQIMMLIIAIFANFIIPRKVNAAPQSQRLHWCSMLIIIYIIIMIITLLYNYNYINSNRYTSVHSLILQ